MSSKIKKKAKLERIAEMKILKAKYCFEVLEFSPIHLRVIGYRAIDCWPGTAKAWLIGSNQKAFRASPSEVFAMASAENQDLLPDGCAEHMASI
jgi:hypothetical protein